MCFPLEARVVPQPAAPHRAASQVPNEKRFGQKSCLFRSIRIAFSVLISRRKRRPRCCSDATSVEVPPHQKPLDSLRLILPVWFERICGFFEIVVAAMGGSVFVTSSWHDWHAISDRSATMATHRMGGRRDLRYSWEKCGRGRQLRWSRGLARGRLCSFSRSERLMNSFAWFRFAAGWLIEWS